MQTVRDLLKNKGQSVWSVRPDDSTLAVLDQLAEKNIGALPVLEDGVLVGIISERDIVRQIAASRDCALDTHVREHMTSPVFTVRPEQTIEECMQLMTQKHIRHLPVTDAQNKVIGLISIGDVVKNIISDQDWTIHNLERYIQGGVV